MNNNYILSKIDKDEMETHLVSIAKYFLGELQVELIKDGRQSYYWVGTEDGRLGFHISKERNKWSTRRSGYGDATDWIEMYFLNELSLRLGNKIAFGGVGDKIMGIPHKYDYFINKNKDQNLRSGMYEVQPVETQKCFEQWFSSKIHHLFIEK